MDREIHLGRDHLQKDIYIYTLILLINHLPTRSSIISSVSFDTITSSYKTNRNQIYSKCILIMQILPWPGLPGTPSKPRSPFGPAEPDKPFENDIDNSLF